jgi:pimeloyl-ACP methyl ester carboxylesterase
VPTFDSTGVPINYIDEGSGPAVILVHGFASSLHGNWRAPGIVDALVGAGRRVVALDCRGHGRSGKPHDPAAYAGRKMQDDVIALLDHLRIERADLVGYSMGGMISAMLLVNYSERFRSVVIAGAGGMIVEGGRTRERADAIARAMEAPDGKQDANELARGFRAFAEASGNDLQALAAMQRSDRRGAFDPRKLAGVRLPVVVIVGDRDTLVGKPEPLAAAIPGARSVTVPGDHLSAVGAPELKAAILSFLAEHSPVAVA